MKKLLELGKQEKSHKFLQLTTGQRPVKIAVEQLAEILVVDIIHLAKQLIRPLLTPTGDKDGRA